MLEKEIEKRKKREKIEKELREKEKERLLKQKEAQKTSKNDGKISKKNVLEKKGQDQPMRKEQK